MKTLKPFILIGTVILVLGLMYVQYVKSAKDYQPALDKSVEQTETNNEGGGSMLELTGDGDTTSLESDTADWATYTNESCNFSIKFPESYIEIRESNECTDGKDYNASTTLVVPQIANQDGCLINELGQSMAENCEIHEIFVLNSEPTAEGTGITNTTTTVAGIDSKVISTNSQITIAIPYEGLWYNYLYSFAPGNKANAEQLIEKIAETIEFE